MPAPGSSPHLWTQQDASGCGSPWLSASQLLRLGAPGVQVPPRGASLSPSQGTSVKALRAETLRAAHGTRHRQSLERPRGQNQRSETRADAQGEGQTHTCKDGQRSCEQHTRQEAPGGGGPRLWLCCESRPSGGSLRGIRRAEPEPTELMPPIHSHDSRARCQQTLGSVADTTPHARTRLPLGQKRYGCVAWEALPAGATPTSGWPSSPCHPELRSSPLACGSSQARRILFREATAFLQSPLLLLIFLSENLFPTYQSPAQILPLYSAPCPPRSAVTTAASAHLSPWHSWALTAAPQVGTLHQTVLRLLQPARGAPHRAQMPVQRMLYLGRRSDPPPCKTLT